MELLAQGRITWRQRLIGMLTSMAILTIPTSAQADEGGISFWIPGFLGSLAAAPLQPGFSLTNEYYHSSVSAGSEVTFARQVITGNLKRKFTGNLNINLDGNADLLLIIPGYTFKKQMLGGQATVVMLVPYGRTKTHVSGTLSGNLGLGPGFVIGAARTDQVIGNGDLAPMFNLRWNVKTVHNFMTYIAGDLTAGAYDSTRFANLGINHNSIDAGGAYTYFNPENGREFSATLGFTYNYPNFRTHYQNGIDSHLDISASKFFAKKKQIGLVGYAYQQLSCDSGSNNQVGCFKSHVYGIGPQLGYIASGKKYSLFINLKGYDEFNAKYRASGWNTWLSVSLSPAATA